jgi:hypothetical protein
VSGLFDRRDDRVPGRCVEPETRDQDDVHGVRLRRRIDTG